MIGNNEFEQMLIEINELQIQEANKHGRRSREEKFAKLGEEFGEIAADVCLINGYKNNDRDPADLIRNIKEEYVDTMLMALDMFFSEGASVEELKQTIRLKLDKWKSKHV